MLSSPPPWCHLRRTGQRSSSHFSGLAGCRRLGVTTGGSGSAVARPGDHVTNLRSSVRSCITPGWSAAVIPGSDRIIVERKLVDAPLDRPIRLVIIDDQEMVRKGFGALLQAQPDMEVVGEAADGSRAIDLVTSTDPDVVLMDIRMPEVDGLEAARQIAALPDHSPRLIMLTTFDIDHYVFDALRAGASGFLLKDARVEDLIHAVRVVAAGEALLSPSVTRSLIAEFVARPDRQHAPVRLEELTERELEVMRQVARGLSNSEISAELFVAEQTVKTHVSRVLAKLGLRDRAQIVVAAYESGVVTAGD
ncbi:DNA-binding response regulator [Parenemella sanctibonifatiensis]|uniref:DNA-binding response regulator n=1 Tax=Parenemella sanctibonifatiensis TaxID=2016505 RepID=A0A255E7X0_9ACTN|nr:DNA-binding response regulator [Parenemella sanctibonifatiensis]